MKFPRPLDSNATAHLSVMQSLRKFFSRLGKASEDRLKRVTEQLNTLVNRIVGRGATVAPPSIRRPPVEPEPPFQDLPADLHPSVLIDEVQGNIDETKEFYAIKNFLEKLPPGITPPQCFNLTLELLRKLGRAEEAMDLHGLYTFKYIAVTKGKYYDVFPVIMLNSVGRTFYKGYNFHWERAPQYVESVNRTYNFSRIQSKFYRIKPHELEYFLQLPTFMPIYIPE